MPSTGNNNTIVAGGIINNKIKPFQDAATEVGINGKLEGEQTNENPSSPRPQPRKVADANVLSSSMDS